MRVASSVDYGSTEKLIADLINERPEAQEAIVRLVYGRVRRVAKSFCGADADADDVAQQVILEVLRDAKSYRFEGALEHWVDRITMRCALRSVQRARRRRGLLARWLIPGAPPWGAESKVASHDADSIDGVLRRLAPERRQVVLLHHGLGYSVDEIADMLETPRGTIKDRLVMSKRQLRKLLRGELEERGWLQRAAAYAAGARESDDE